MELYFTLYGGQLCSKIWTKGSFALVSVIFRFLYMDTVSMCLYFQYFGHVAYYMSAPRWNDQHSTPLFGVVLLLNFPWSGAIFCTVWRPTSYKIWTKGFHAWLLVVFIFFYMDRICMCLYCQFFGLVDYFISRRVSFHCFPYYPWKSSLKLAQLLLWRYIWTSFISFYLTQVLWSVVPPNSFGWSSRSNFYHFASQFPLFV